MSDQLTKCLVCGKEDVKLYHLGPWPLCHEHPPDEFKPTEDRKFTVIETADKVWLGELAGALDETERCGAKEDAPEGTRYIMWSDTYARQMADKLREIANR